MQLAAMANFPTERAAVEALAKTLERAAMDSGIMMQAILDDVLTGGAWCPTPFDLRKLAMDMKKLAREKREGSIHAKWREIYGEPNPQWSIDLLTELAGATHAETRANLHARAIREMLYYTEGDGKLMGDREFWEGPRLDGLQSAREFDLDLTNHADLVDRIRREGGWRTERELQLGPAPEARHLTPEALR